MDRNTLIGLLLIGIIFIAFGDKLFPSDPKPEAIEQLEGASGEDPSQVKSPATTDNTPIGAQSTDTIAPASPELVESQEEEVYILENDLLKVSLSSLGGRIIETELLAYKRFDSTELILFERESSNLNHLYNLGSTTINSSERFFTANEAEFISRADTNRPAAISFSYAIGPDTRVEHIYELKEGEYLMDHRVKTYGLSKVAAANPELIFDWQMNTPRQEKGLSDERLYSEVYYRNTENDVDYETRTDLAGTDIEEDANWISLKQKFFATVLVSKEPLKNAHVVSSEFEDDSFVKTMSFKTAVTLSNDEYSERQFNIFLGPLQYHLLKDYDMKFQNMLPWGWGIFRWVNSFFIAPIFYLLSSMSISYGIIILLMTLLVKLILLPFLYKSYQSNAKMKALKPEIDELKAKHKDDPQKQQAEQLKLWKKTGVNPLGGCLPMLFQMPILFAVFRFFPAAIELRQKPFLWANDLSTYDDLIKLPIDIPFYGSHVSIFTLLMTVSTFLQMRLNNQMSAGTSDQMKQMRIIMYAMPVMFMFVLNSYSSGLTYYYFISNIITFAQQFFIRKTINEEKIRSKIETNKEKNKHKKKSNFSKRLEEISKQRNRK